MVLDTISIFDTGNGKPLVCPRCKGIDFEVKMERKIAKLIILEDSNNSSSNVHLQVILYDDMVENVTPGDVQMVGEMNVERKAGSNKNTKMDNVLHSTSIKYLKKREVVNTPEDIRNFYKWKQLCDKLAKCPACLEWAKRKHIHPFKKTPMYTPITFNDRLVEMFAPNVVGHRVAKLGLLRSIVGGIRRGDGPLSGKIHTFMVGVKGTAKSKLGKETTRIKLNSGHVSGTHASTKTITAIVDPDTKTLMLGVIPLSDLVAIDEVDKIPREEQARLLDILEEQAFSKDAYGYHFENIPALTTIIATGNPINPNFLDPNKVESNELNILDTLRDRFTQVFIFRDDNTTPEKRKAFAIEMNAIRKRPQPSYTFLRKYLTLAGTIIPVYSPESEKMLNEFWAQQNPGGLMDNRFLNHIFKIAEAQTRLQLSDEIDEDLATQTMESIKLMLLQYAENVKIVVKPSQITFDKFLEILQNAQCRFTISELCKLSCKEDAQISEYLGTEWSLEHNWKLKRLVNSLRKHPNVREIKSNPLVFKWFVEPFQSDASDASDTASSNVIDNRLIISEDVAISQEKGTSDTSDTSDTPDRYQDFPPKCYRCDYSNYQTKREYEYHCVNIHPGLPGYPGPADIKALDLEPQGMEWEG